MNKIGIIMGSDSDYPTMHEAELICKEFGVDYEIKVISAHRTPFDMINYGKNALENGLSVIIAGAGGAAHLPGMIASTTSLPVIGVPILTKSLSGLDSLYSIAQMPPGVPVATVAIGGAKNAGLLAIQILAVNNKDLSIKLIDYKLKIADESRKKNEQEIFTK